VTPLRTRPLTRVAPESDAPLLAAIARGDLGSLGILYDRHAGAVWRVVHRVLGGADGIDDVVHAAFLKVVEIAHTFDGRPSARSWVTGIAVRLALRKTRGAGRLARMLARFAHVGRHTDVVDPEATALGRERVGTLDRALADLSVAKRTVFILVELEGLAHEDVAEALRIPLPTVRTRLYHAKQALRAAVSDEETP
jgi:RNA polymerase sigma-70 factor (ECF subfamily)